MPDACYSFYVETSNLTLEEIDYIFAQKDEVSELGQQMPAGRGVGDDKDAAGEKAIVHQEASSETVDSISEN